MTQRIDGTDAPEGMWPVYDWQDCRRCAARLSFPKCSACRQSAECQGYKRKDAVNVSFMEGVRIRMILCIGGRLPEPPGWAKNARCWFKLIDSNGSYSGIWFGSIETYKGYLGQQAGPGLLGVEFSGKECDDHHRD